MPLFRRCDGDLITDEPLVRRMMPYLMPRRSDSLVFFEQEIDVTALLAHLEQLNEGRPEEERLSFFGAALCGVARVMGQRPKMNRFIVGRHVYQRRKIEFSFGIKKRMTDDAPLSMMKLGFQPDDTLQTVAERLRGALSFGRCEKRSKSEREMTLALKLPPPMLRFGMWLINRLDRLNLLPKFMIEADELYTSATIANLGSVGIGAPFHHLYEWGTCSIFGAIGIIEKRERATGDGRTETRQVVTFRWTFDERAAEGLYCAKALNLFKAYLESPSILEHPPER